MAKMTKKQRMYVLNDGAVVTEKQIRAAYAEGRAVLVHGRGDGRTLTGLMLDGQHRDTRGECYSVWEEVWTTIPTAVAQCLKAASCR